MDTNRIIPHRVKILSKVAKMDIRDLPQSTDIIEKVYKGYSRSTTEFFLERQ